MTRFPVTNGKVTAASGTARATTAVTVGAAEVVAISHPGTMAVVAVAVRMEEDGIKGGHGNFRNRRKECA